MVISLASRSASRMIRSKDLRNTSARSRGFLPAQPSKASLAASTAALASSTVALATEAILVSVAGSSTSKRPPSEDLRHLPPIHRSVGTLARRFSYMEHSYDWSEVGAAGSVCSLSHRTGVTRVRHFKSAEVG